MIGTTFKLGFDGTSVSKGLGNMSRMLGSFGKQIGVGMAQRIGHGVTDLMGRIVMAVPEALKDTGEWAGGLTDMATATGLTVRQLVVLEEMFRLAGVSAKESGAVMSRFALNLKTARSEGGPALDALHDLGFYATDFAEVGLDESFKKIATRLAQMAPQLENAEGIMADLFGAKLGYQQLKLFKDFDSIAKQAENNVGKMGDALDKDAPALDHFFDSLGRFENFKRSLSSIVMSEVLFKMFGDGKSMDKFFDSMDPEKLRAKVREFMKILHNTRIYLREEGVSGIFGDFAKDIGKAIGEGIKESIMPSMPSLPKWIGGGSASTGGSASSDISALIQKSNTLLADIRKEVGVAKFA